MQHIDPDVLALLALGEDVESTTSADERDHLSACPRCTEEMAELAVVAQTGRALTPDDALVPPAPAVWDRISAELGLGADAARPFASTAAPEPVAPATVTSLSERRERRRGGIAQMLVAACVALVLGVSVGVLWERRVPSADETPLASAQLDALPDWTTASGEARLEESSAGVRQIVVDLAAPTTEDGYREVWLIADDLSGLVSLGILDGAQGRFDIPAGLDLTEFSLVDVSEEHFDGDPSHSGDSIVRGALEDLPA
ncbi:anti-sigma-K factor RskA [Sanguibacter antarcticus]|uniref:Anti-sigma-K factor RskA n=1 Tax=Sanguibacter antarcticus TaxID=372484 RepID=A0A2A9E8M9_9MICO|nr:anti-sigma-K factor RskA [Sanguibacter antarcticus]